MKILLACIAASLMPLLVGCAAQAPQDPTSACQGLVGTSLSASAFSLPTNGAVLTAATLVKATEANNRNGEYCKLLGHIKPVNAGSPSIHFQVNLPTQWNGKALQMGGGGYNGQIPQTLSVAQLGLQQAPTPLTLGYATLASDSGHQAPDINDASFALDD
jgi:hypothetical protein